MNLYDELNDYERCLIDQFPELNLTPEKLLSFRHEMTGLKECKDTAPLCSGEALAQNAKLSEDGETLKSKPLAAKTISKALKIFIQKPSKDESE